MAGALLNPDTKGSTRRVMSYLNDQYGLSGYMLPSNRVQLCTSIAEMIMDMTHVQSMIGHCRHAADKRVIGIDGQYKPLLSVLYQTKHGMPQAEGAEEVDPVKVLLTVACEGGILLTKPTRSEGFPYQSECLQEAVGETGKDDVLFIFSDAPERLDRPQIYTTFRALECVGKDTLHVALKVETASGEKVTPFSKNLRRCLKKFAQGFDDGLPYFRAGGQPLPAMSLSDVVANMHERTANRRHTLITSDLYDTTAYGSIILFLKDVAALTKVYSAEMDRRVAGGGTIRGSLDAATTPVALGYIMNIARFASRHPNVPVLRGTTHNEAFHLEQKAFWRNVMKQTARHARLIARVVTLVKLIALVMKKTDCVCLPRQTELLRKFITELLHHGLNFDALLDSRVTYPPCA
jgi:hypothetical protein